MNISKYISYKEAIRTDVRGVENTPTPDQLSAMKYVAQRVFDPVRKKVGGALFVSSFFRNAEVNKAVKGSKTSQHMKGEAIDIDCDIFGHGTNKEVFDYIRKNLPFDQLLWEYGTDDNPSWVHVSLRRDNNNRKQVLRVKKVGGKVVYEPM
jgi:zinc D-Ala-D-Ala carboxypeptidase